MGNYKKAKSVNVLLTQYNEAIKDIRKLLNKINKELDPLKNIYSNPNEKEFERKKAREEAAPLLLDKSIVKSWENNLLYGIEWMITGRRPGSRRGAERRASYEIEVPFEPYWIQRRKDNVDTDFIRYLDEDHEQTNEQKEHLVNAMTSCLSDRQKEMLQLSGNGYSNEEIANLLGIHKGTVSRTIARAKEKIEDEGWFMA